METNQQYTIAAILYEATSSLDYTRERLTQSAISLRDAMDSLVAGLAMGRTVNGLGEVQGRGADVDRLCALFVERQRQLDNLIRLANVAGYSQEASNG